MNSSVKKVGKYFFTLHYNGPFLSFFTPWGGWSKWNAGYRYLIELKKKLVTPFSGFKLPFALSCCWFIIILLIIMPQGRMKKKVSVPQQKKKQRQGVKKRPMKSHRGQYVAPKKPKAVASEKLQRVCSFLFF